jgi:arylsulfatase A-like enzyme
VDDNVGKVLEFLKANGLDENTLIIYMGDQGFFLGEHGWFDKRWMYEESFQMPCLIRFPNQIKPAEKINDFAINVDIAPTILDYAGLEIPKDIQGESLRALLEQDKNKTKNWRKSVYYQYFEYPKWHNVLPHYGIRTEKFKLIHFYFTDDMWEFYDLAKDPNELTNQYHNPTYQQAIKQLKEELKMLQKKYKDDMPIKERKEMTKKFSVKY